VTVIIVKVYNISSSGLLLGRCPLCQGGSRCSFDSGLSSIWRDECAVGEGVPRQRTASSFADLRREVQDPRRTPSWLA